MKPQLTILAISLALAGCGGSGGSDTSASAAPTYTVSGTVTAQNIDLQSKVCADLNQNYMCDSGEPSSTANTSGEFSITSTKKSILSVPLLAQVDSGIAANSSGGSASSYAYIAAPGFQKTSGNEINGISSLLAGYVADGLTIANANIKLKAQLAKSGITISGNIQDDLSASELASLEQNVVSTIKAFKHSNRAFMLAQLSAKFDKSASDYVWGILDTDQITAFANFLEGELKAATALNDTGVLRYFSDIDDKQDVVEPQSSFPGQDAGYGFDKTELNAQTGNGFQFAKLDSSGQVLADDATQWSCVLDQRSGLVWESKTDDENSLQYKDRLLALELPGLVTPYDQDVALATCHTKGDHVCTTQDYVEYINSINLCGKSDWRLPKFHEFYNLLDFGETEKNKDGEVYGLTYKYFPHQTLGIENTTYTGSVWTQSITYNLYTNTAVEGGFYYNEIGTQGADRGNVEPLEIYSGDVDSSANNDSYQFPARLVSLQGK
ncbi:MAG: Lcl domain-containing protein [Vibrio toranzoniae]|uniref:Lcl domain-containing protein n=1 Tax=Vibrio toranzoniae TaxID=1194427 RepID=UPI003F9CA357